MGRTILLLVAFYHWGDARFEGQRPGELDRPLRALHATADQALADVRRAIATIDDARSMRHLTPLLRSLGEP